MDTRNGGTRRRLSPSPLLGGLRGVSRRPGRMPRRGGWLKACPVTGWTNRSSTSCTAGHGSATRARPAGGVSDATGNAKGSGRTLATEQRSWSSTRTRRSSDTSRSGAIRVLEPALKPVLSLSKDLPKGWGLAVLDSAPRTRPDETDTGAQPAEKAEMPLWAVWTILQGRRRGRNASLEPVLSGAEGTAIE